MRLYFYIRQVLIDYKQIIFVLVGSRILLRVIVNYLRWNYTENLVEDHVLERGFWTGVALTVAITFIGFDNEFLIALYDANIDDCIATRNIGKFRSWLFVREHFFSCF